MNNNNPETTEYRISLFTKVLNSAIGLAMLGAAVYFGSIKWKHDTALKFLPTTCLGLLGLLYLLLAFRRRLVITGDSISQVYLFKTKELPMHAIKGQRHEPKMIVLEPVSPEYPQLMINNYDDFANSEQLSQWVKESFTDLNAADKAAEELELNEDLYTGEASGQKQQQLNFAKKLANGYTYVSIVLSFGLLFIQNDWLDVVKLLIPLAGIVLMLWKKGYIFLFTNKRRSIYPHVGLGILMSSAFALIGVTKHAHIGSDLHAFWLPFGLIVLIFAWLCYKGWSPTMKPVAISVLITLAAAVVFSIGAVFTINCSFDQSNANKYYPVILKRYTTYNKGTHYHLRVEPWEPYTQTQTISVSRKFYEKLQEGQAIQINQKEGLLGIGWYTVSIPQRPTYIIP